jgi:hypothetical protein
MQSALGLMLAGGPQEAVIQGGQVAWTVSGVQSGARSLTLPGTWYANHAVTQAGSTYSYTYPGGAQTAPVTILFKPTPWP